MTTTITTARKLLWTSVVASLLALGACNQHTEATNDAKAAEENAKKAAAKTPVDAKKTDGDAKTDDEADAEPATDAPLDERVVKAAGLAKKIEADPTKADEILAEAGLDRASFDALIFEVSTPELAEQYRLARAREG